jgi:hypothetical protein
MATADLPRAFDLRRLAFQLALLGAAALAWGIPFAINTAWRLRFEDAMIVLRYARNLAAGDGFVFNLGEKVLGVTTPLQTLLSTLIFLAGAGSETAPAWQNLAGLFWLAVEAFLLLLLLRRLAFPAAALPASLLLFGGFYGGYLYLGMETHLFTALLLLALLLDLGETPRPWQLGVVLGLAFLTRYDAALLAGLLGVAAWIRDRRFPWQTTLAFFLVAAPWLLFSQLYFGSILPQPLMAKESYVESGVYLGQVYAQWRGVAGEICGVFSRIDRANYVVALLCPLIALAGAVLVGRERRYWPLAAYPFLHLLVYTSIGSDPGFTWHLYLLLPFFLIFAAACASVPLDALRRRLIPRVSESLAASLLVAALLLPLGWHLYKQASYRYRPDPHTGQLQEMAGWMAARYPPSTSLLQPSIGILGYETNFRMVDHAGLVTPGLYFWNDRQCTPLPEVLSRFSPDLVLASPWTATSEVEMGAAGYAPVHVFAEPFRYTLYARNLAR